MTQGNRTYDLVIRGGLIADGLGGQLRSGDVGISDGVITAVGEVDGAVSRVLDVDGALVTPGFVDVHTHYDGQATWSQLVDPSSWHGVTTAVMGNCGVGFAPVRSEHHDVLIELMEGVEDIPGTALHEGIDWSWGSFPEYLDALDRVPHDIDICAQVPHGALRVFVMGERGANRLPATAEDRAAMASIAADAMRAGAIGFSTSRTIAHRSSRGDNVPSLGAAAAELIAIASAVGATGKGVIETISDFDDVEEEFALIREMVKQSGRPLSLSVLQKDDRPELWKDLLRLIDEAAFEGLPIKGQVAVRPVGILLGLQVGRHPFADRPTFRQLEDLSVDAQVARLRQPEVRARILAEGLTDAGERPQPFRQGYSQMFVLGDPPNYEPPPELSIAARAQREGRDPEEVAYDCMLESDGLEFLFYPAFNYSRGSLDDVHTMMQNENTLFGLADGGAHSRTICDASFPTTAVSYWTRGRDRGELFDVPWLIRKQTAVNAAAVGLLDRGVVAPGYRADLNVIDYDHLELRPPVAVDDLPAGGTRLVQQADGYVATIVAGEVTYEGGQHTGALPGRLVRGQQPTPFGSTR